MCSALTIQQTFLTKHLTQKGRAEDLLNQFGCECRGGRPDSATKLRQAAGTFKGEQLAATVGGVQSLEWHGQVLSVARGRGWP